MHNNPLPPTPLKVAVMFVNVCKHKFTCTNVTPKKKKTEGILHLRSLHLQFLFILQSLAFMTRHQFFSRVSVICESRSMKGVTAVTQ